MSSPPAASGRDGAHSRVARGTDPVDGNVRTTLALRLGSRLVRSRTSSVRASLSVNPLRADLSFLAYPTEEVVDLVLHLRGREAGLANRTMLGIASKIGRASCRERV